MYNLFAKRKRLKKEVCKGEGSRSITFKSVGSRPLGRKARTGEAMKDYNLILFELYSELNELEKRFYYFRIYDKELAKELEEEIQKIKGEIKDFKERNKELWTI